MQSMQQRCSQLGKSRCKSPAAIVVIVRSWWIGIKFLLNSYQDLEVGVSTSNIFCFVLFYSLPSYTKPEHPAVQESGSKSSRQQNDSNRQGQPQELWEELLVVWSICCLEDFGNEGVVAKLFCHFCYLCLCIKSMVLETLKKKSTNFFFKKTNKRFCLFSEYLMPTTAKYQLKDI